MDSRRKFIQQSSALGLSHLLLPSFLAKASTKKIHLAQNGLMVQD
jgi:hypothetical protein